MSAIFKIDTINQVHEFYQLKSPRHPLVSVLPINDDIINFDYGNHTYVSALYHISLKIGVSGSWGYGRNTYDFQDGTMTFIRPNQATTVESNESQRDTGGWILLFHPDLIRKSSLSQKMKQYNFFSYEVNEALHLSEAEIESVNGLINKIESELDQNIDRHSQGLIVSNIELLLDYCLRYYDRQFYTRTNINQDYSTKFEHLLSEYFESEKPVEQGLPTVKYCGESLNMSPHYLSDLLKKETGKSAQEHIYYYLIDHAKNQLLSTNDTVSQIAFSLGFDYSQHFSKLFKSKTGMTPVEYRNLN